MRIGPRYKICRRLGDSVFDKCQTTKFALSDSKKKIKKRREGRRVNRSEYGAKLIEKQKVRFTYGISEKNLSNYIKEAQKQSKDKPSIYLYKLLESRLDNVVYRFGLASSRRAARQMVSHGHVTVNNKKLNVPSYQVKQGDIVAVRSQSKAKKFLSDLADKLKNYPYPKWLLFDEKKMEGKLTKNPVLGDFDSNLDLDAVLEFYSRV